MRSNRKPRSPKRGSPRTALAKKPREGTLRVMRTWENFEQSVGGREKLIDSLQHCPDAEGQRLLQHIEDPRAKRQSLRTLCADARVSFHQLYLVFKDSVRARAHAEALIVQSEFLPEVMRDTCLDAMAQSSLCPFCDGVGRRDLDDETLTCLQCEGTGRIRKPGSAESRKLLFDSAGLTGKRSPLVAIEQNTGWGDIGIEGVHSFEDLVEFGNRAMERKPTTEFPDRRALPEATGPAQPDVVDVDGEDVKESEDA